jgi:hypothetical protein
VFNYEFFTEDELQAVPPGAVFLFDVESFQNYFLVAFKHYDTGKIAYFEASNGETFPVAWLDWMLSRFCLIGFNCKRYDLILCGMALAGYDPTLLKAATNAIIIEGLSSGDLQKRYKFDVPFTNHIDLIDVAPLKGGLKLYAARLHARFLQDLPFDPDTVLSREQISTVRNYCFNDLENTGLLLRSLNDQLELRSALSVEYKLDLRSKSDAQIAETIMSAEIERLTGERPKRPKVNPLAVYGYHVPAWCSYRLPQLQQILETVRTAQFRVTDAGRMVMPPSLAGANVTIADMVYRMGIGGLHSSEKEITHVADANTVIRDRDVSGYYPEIILTLGLYPEHIGPAYLLVYRGLVIKRLTAKQTHDYIVSENLKIAVNGSFGKSGSPYSVLYAPQMMIQITMTGQLGLLLLIEDLVLAGIEVISANTDGVVSKVRKEQIPTFETIVGTWEQKTAFKTEETDYASIHSRDVNSYIAVMADGSPAKTKGAYANPWDNKKKQTFILQKNPALMIVIDAAVACIEKGIPVKETIENCKAIERFVVVRQVPGGAQKDGRYLGKVIRWYYANGVVGNIEKCDSGHTVSLSEGGKPCMILPDNFPNDIDYDRYIRLANEILEDVAFIQRSNTQLRLGI